MITTKFIASVSDWVHTYRVPREKQKGKFYSCDTIIGSLGIFSWKRLYNFQKIIPRLSSLVKQFSFQSRAGEKRSVQCYRRGNCNPKNRRNLGVENGANIAINDWWFVLFSYFFFVFVLFEFMHNDRQLVIDTLLFCGQMSQWLSLQNKYYKKIKMTSPFADKIMFNYIFLLRYSSRFYLTTMYMHWHIC